MMASLHELTRWTAAIAAAWILACPVGHLSAANPVERQTDAATTDARLVANNAGDNHSGDNHSGDNPAGDRDRRSSRTADQVEDRVLEMVDAHLPHLTVLLDRLRQKEPQRYESAIRGLSRWARRLATAKRRGPQAYELELQIVKAMSSVDLLVAKLMVRDDKEDRAALRDAAEEVKRAELARAQFEADQLRRRLEKMQQQWRSAKERVDQRQSDLSQDTHEFFRQALRKAGRIDAPRKDTDRKASRVRPPKSDRAKAEQRKNDPGS